MTVQFSLTRRQKDTLDALKTYRSAHGQMPSLSELERALGLSSKSGVLRLLKGLEERGRIRRLSRKSRAIVLLDDAPAAPALTPQLQQQLESFCRLRGEEPAAVIADAVALYLDAEAPTVPAEQVEALLQPGGAQ